jgi:glycosyltransferase involved in cell wall biosynthesis
MISTRPIVSVIIPIFNRKRYLSEAIESVLSQTVLPDEVIVIDDGSTDGSVEIVKGFPSVRYHYQPNSGVSAARNQGVKLAQGNFFAFLDSDDRWVPDKLERQIAAFEADPNLAIVFGHVQQFYSPELDEQDRQKIHIPKEVLPGYHVGAMLSRREAFFQVGFFETSLKCGEFVSWYLRAIDSGLQIKIFPEVVMQRRLHQMNHGRSENLDRKDYAKVLKASLDRRRSKQITLFSKEP